MWFLLNMVLGIKAKQLHLGLIGLWDIVPEVLLFVQLQLCKTQSCLHFLFRQKKSSPDNPSTQAVLVQSLYNCVVMDGTITFNVISEGCRVRDVALAFLGIF